MNIVSAKIEHASKKALLKIANMYNIELYWYDSIPIIGYWLLRPRINKALVCIWNSR
jgi:hypothetical protein